MEGGDEGGPGTAGRDSGPGNSGERGAGRWQETGESRSIRGTRVVADGPSARSNRKDTRVGNGTHVAAMAGED